MAQLELGDYCGRCFGWIWDSECPCGRFKHGINVDAIIVKGGDAMSEAASPAES